MSRRTWVHVEFPGHGTFWIYPDALRGQDNSPLAPEHHIRDGHLAIPECFSGGSYAHVYEKRIVRFRTPIGTVSDLKLVFGGRYRERRASMRWRRITQANLGETRTVRRFLLVPRCIGGDCRWLERASWTQLFGWNGMDLMWTDLQWAEDSERGEPT
jgi:hypothetical protein